LNRKSRLPTRVIDHFCMRKSLIAFFVFLLFAFTGALNARAQSVARASLFALDTSAYPTLFVALDVFDDGGNFVTGLNADQVTLLEDNLPVTPLTFEQRQPGVLFAVALDPSRSFAFRSTDAVSRLDKVKSALQAWAAAHSSSWGDVLTLVATGGVSTTSDRATAVAEALAAYQPDLLTISPSLDTLSNALDAVSVTGPQVGMKRVVLYIASPPEADSISALQNLTQRAVDLNIRVHVWIVDSPAYFSTSGATALKDLAIRTGGQYTLFSDTDPLPDPETYLSPLRYSYALTYASAIRTPGMHTLAAQVAVNGETVTTEALSFDLNVLPPNPILVSPPEQIVRQGPDPRTTDFSLFQPAQQTIQAIVEFPDSHPRPLAETRLYVDGEIVDENTSEPFGEFLWDLNSYVTSGDHILQVEAVDSLGLRNVSLGIKVNVTVVQPERGLLPFLARNSLWIVIGGVTLASMTLGIALLVGRRRKEEKETRSKDVLGVVEPTPKRRLSLTGWRHSSQKQAEAYLVRLREDGQPMDALPIPVLIPEMTFGSDPLEAQRVLDDPSVAPLHARLKQEEERFVLIDEDSVAGTWVNYERITSPRVLKHGDILHIGRISYRFLLRNPAHVSPPTIRRVQE